MLLNRYSLSILLAVLFQTECLSADAGLGLIVNATSERIRVVVKGGDNKAETNIVLDAGSKIRLRNHKHYTVFLVGTGKAFRLDVAPPLENSNSNWESKLYYVIRENGQLSLEVLDSQGASQGFTNVETPSQNLLVMGVMGTVGLGGGFVFRPHLDFKLQSREDATGSDAGSGWMVAIGGDIPIRVLGGYDFFPKARVLLGSIKDITGVGIGLLGMEFKGTVRLSF